MGRAKRVASRELFDEILVEDIQKQALPERSELLQSSVLFPQQLLQLKDAPNKLYALGKVEALNTPAIAIVGARKATTYGLECARRFARKAALWGITVVSGGAIGCDMAAHKGALGAGGCNVVVLGSGADVVYPLRARSLFKEILAAKGALISEAPWGSPPLAWAFSKRNRIIAALAQATLIVEAGLPSGTFQTADHTLALGNEVLVVPGPIFSKESKGSNRLMAQGAIPIIDDESFEDALAHIFGPRRAVANPMGVVCSHVTASGQESEAYDTSSLGPKELKQHYFMEHIIMDLSANPMTIDALAQAHRKDTVEVIRAITKLEIEGKVERLRDGRYMTKIR